MAGEEPIRISLRELYVLLAEHLAETEPFDVEAGLAELNRWIDEQEEKMTHSEAVVMAEAQRDRYAETLQAARVYLRVTGAVPRSELARVLASHLEVGQPTAAALVIRLIADGELQMTENVVALPAGSVARDTEEN